MFCTEWYMQLSMMKDIPNWKYHKILALTFKHYDTESYWGLEEILGFITGTTEFDNHNFSCDETATINSCYTNISCCTVQVLLSYQSLSVYFLMNNVDLREFLREKVYFKSHPLIKFLIALAHHIKYGYPCHIVLEEGMRPKIH